MGIEPTYPAWKAGVLPLNYTRKVGVTGFEPATSWPQTRRSSQAEPHPVMKLFALSATSDILADIEVNVNRFFGKIFFLLIWHLRYLKAQVLYDGNSMWNEFMASKMWKNKELICWITTQNNEVSIQNTSKQEFYMPNRQESLWSRPSEQKKGRRTVLCHLPYTFI